MRLHNNFKSILTAILLAVFIFSGLGTTTSIAQTKSKPTVRKTKGKMVCHWVATTAKTTKGKTLSVKKAARKDKPQLAGKKAGKAIAKTSANKAGKNSKGKTQKSLRVRSTAKSANSKFVAKFVSSNTTLSAENVRRKAELDTRESSLNDKFKDLKAGQDILAQGKIDLEKAQGDLKAREIDLAGRIKKVGTDKQTNADKSASLDKRDEALKTSESNLNYWWNMFLGLLILLVIPFAFLVYLAFRNSGKKRVVETVDDSEFETVIKKTSSSPVSNETETVTDVADETAKPKKSWFSWMRRQPKTGLSIIPDENRIFDETETTTQNEESDDDDNTTRVHRRPIIT